MTTDATHLFPHRNASDGANALESQVCPATHLEDQLRDQSRSLPCGQSSNGAFQRHSSDATNYFLNQEVFGPYQQTPTFQGEDGSVGHFHPMETATASVLMSSTPALPCYVLPSQPSNDYSNSQSSQPPVTAVTGLQDEPRGTETSQDLQHDIHGYNAGQEALFGGDIGDIGNTDFIFDFGPTDSGF